jgi:hypothetical protein
LRVNYTSRARALTPASRAVVHFLAGFCVPFATAIAGGGVTSWPVIAFQPANDPPEAR